MNCELGLILPKGGHFFEELSVAADSSGAGVWNLQKEEAG